VFWNLRTDANKLVLPPYTWAPATVWVDAEGALPVSGPLGSQITPLD
jgi:hypothetical protein